MDIQRNTIYAVKALSDHFDRLLPDIPVICHAALVPFKDKIINDGFLTGPVVYVGRGMAGGLNQDYKRAQKQKKIVKTL